MLKIINILFILFIYTNLLTSKLKLFSVPVSKALFILCMMAYVVYLVHNRGFISRRIVFYMFTSFLCILTLSTISLVMGNELGNVSVFIVPILFLFLLPILLVLINKYGCDKYLRHIQYATLILSSMLIAMYILSEILGMRYLMYAIAGRWDNITIMGSGDGLRVFAKTAIFIPAGLLITFMRIRKGNGIMQYVYFALMCIAMYITKTIGIWIACMFSMILFYFMVNRLRLKTIVIGMATVLVVVMVAISVHGRIMTGDMPMLKSKDESIAAKQQQVSKAMDMFVEKPVFGYGIGYKYRSMDYRETEDVYLEVFYAMILSSAGIFGALLYSFIFLYYPFRYAVLRCYRPDTAVIFASFMAVLIASLSNPYIWSGGVGLFFPCMLAALMECNLISEWSDRESVCENS